MDISQSQIVSFIWGIADDCLRDVFVRGQYRDVILPMVVLRRFDALLEPTKEAVEQEIKEQREIGLDETTFDEGAIADITHLSFYNSSKWTLNRIKSQATDNNDILYSNFVEYLNGYSENVKDVLRNFKYYEKAKRLAESDRLLAVIEKITDPYINLTDREATDPDGLPLPPLSNIAMGTVFEELLRRFNEENNEETGAHFTPRDAISLLARLVFESVKENLPKVISLYDPAEGSGGMLTESFEYLTSLGISPEAIELNGTEINPETYAICKADLIIKGVDPSGMHQGNTITEDHFRGKSFGYCITNPPYGKSWKIDKPKIYHDNQLIDHRFELPLINFRGEMETLDCTPRTSDGQLLFIMEEVDKMKPLDYQPQGSRIASVHNGSSLFTGDAGQGENNVRRYLVENDLVDAIVQLPNNIFYNTGISTYVWLLTNKKAEHRRGRVQLIDASQAFEKLRKNQGQRNCTITPEHAEQIVQTYNRFADQPATPDCPVESKVFRNDEFRYDVVLIERPLRLRSQFCTLKVDELLYDTKEKDFSKYLFQTYGEQVFEGLDEKVTEIKAYLQEQEVKMTDKKLASLIATKAWKERRELQEAALQLMHHIGTERTFMDYNLFDEEVKQTAKELGLKLSATQRKAICRAMSEVCPEAAPVISKVLKKNDNALLDLTDNFGIPPERLADYGIFTTESGSLVQYESDSNLRDTEKVPVSDDIYDYFQREVRPYVADAWIELPQTKIGCDISFNKYFYRPQPLRSLAENEADIRALDEESKGFIQQILNLK